MGVMWIDPPEDSKVYPMQGQPPLPFDPTKLTSAKDFPKKCWGADFKSILYLIDFSREPGWQLRVLDKIPLPPEPDSQDMMEGLKDLVKLQIECREQALPEILAQNSEFQLYFCSHLGIYPRSHPQSYLMLKIAARIGELVMVWLKSGHKSVRPSQIYPRLTPPVPVPPHSSYPSGHALISHLMARMVKAIVPDLEDASYNLAKRIARNREIAGLHFWWDSKASEIAAKNTFDVIVGLDDYAFDLGEAKKEW